MNNNYSGKEREEFTELFPRDYVCTNCGRRGSIVDSSVRRNGSVLEHKCPDSIPQAGHFAMRYDPLKKGEEAIL